MVTSQVDALVSTFRKRMCGGGRAAWAFRTSLAVVRIAPSVVIIAFLCSEISFWVSLMAPVLRLAFALGRWGGVYHTSAAYDIFGIAIVV